MTFDGYGAVFGNVDSYGDVIQPGAFAESLAQSAKSGVWPAMLLQHGGWGMGAEDMTPIGIWTSLSEDGVGLKVSGKLADTARGREAYALLKMQPGPPSTACRSAMSPKSGRSAASQRSRAARSRRSTSWRSASSRSPPTARPGYPRSSRWTRLHRWPMRKPSFVRSEG